MASVETSLSLDRGEIARLVMCTPELDANYRIVGLDGSNVEIVYQQYLARCSVEDDTPGLYLTIRAGLAAQPTRVEVMSRDDNPLSFASLVIDIPDRAVISDASLSPVSTENPRLYLLELKSGETFDFSNVKLTDVSFPQGPWPSIQLLKTNKNSRLPQDTLSSESTFVAERAKVQFMVQVEGEQRTPAKILISNAKKEGVSVEVVAHVSLPPPTWAQSMSPESEKYVDIDGIKTRYFDQGSGEPMLLVHGGQAGSAGFAAWSWMPNFAALSNDFRVIALDRVGQGYTDNPKNDESYKNYYQTVVDHVWGFIEKLGLENIHLVGHSQGGWPVTRIALDHPEIIKSLTIVDSATAAPADREGGSVNFYGFLSRFIHPPDGETAESILRELNMYSFTGNNITETQIARLLELARLPKMAVARSQMVKSRMNPAHPSYRKLKATLLDDIENGKLKVPALIVWGRNDPEGSYPAGVKLFELMNASAEDVRFHSFERAGHLPSKEYPADFNRLVTDFALRN